MLFCAYFKFRSNFGYLKSTRLTASELKVVGEDTVVMYAWACLEVSAAMCKLFPAFFAHLHNYVPRMPRFENMQATYMTGASYSHKYALLYIFLLLYMALVRVSSIALKLCPPEIYQA